MPIHPMHRLRGLALAAIALSVAAPLVPAAVAGVSPINCSSRASGAPQRVGPWQGFAPGKFEPGAGIDSVTNEVIAFAVDPVAPGRVVVTNGNSIKLSEDGGCTWFPTLALPAVPSASEPLVSGNTTKITGIAISPAGSRRIWLMAEESVTGGESRPHILYSDTGMPNSWRLADSGLPPVGRPTILRVSPVTPKVAYLAISGATSADTSTPGGLPLPGQPVEPPGLLWGTSDGGTNWTARANTVDFGGVTSIKSFDVDYTDPAGQTIWAVVNGALWLSGDGGQSFSRPDGTSSRDYQLTTVEALPNGAFARVIAFGAGGRSLFFARDGWDDEDVPFSSAISAAYAGGEIFVAVPDNSRTTVLARKTGMRQWRDVTLASAGNERYDLREAGVSGPTVYLESQSRVWRYLGEQAKTQPGSTLPQLPGVGDPPPVRGRLTPSSYVATIPPRETRTVTYHLDLPPSPTPLELYLLVDNSGSMKPIMVRLSENLRKVALRLVDKNVPVSVGLGITNTQPSGLTIGSINARPVYERLVKIGPIGPELQQALNGLKGDGGSGEEAQLESLYQAARGSGMRYNALIPAYSIPPGEQAGFSMKSETMRVILHATDEAFSQNIREGHNDFDEVAAVLREMGILQVGLSRGKRDAQRDLARMAQLTGAVSRTGIDCNNDGFIDTPQRGGKDIGPSMPLVCPGIGEGFESMLFSMLDSLVDNKPVEIVTSKSPVVGAVSKRKFSVDVKRPFATTFDVTYTCVGVRPGTYSVNLGALLRNSYAARAAASITCGTSPVAIPREPGQQAVPPQTTTAIQPAPVAPVPPLPAAQAQAQSQIQSQAQAQPQAGAANQEQDQFQLATVTDEVQQRRTGEQLAMSALDTRPREEQSPAHVLLTGMALAAGAGAVAAHRRRTRTAPAPAWVRRRY